MTKISNNLHHAINGLLIFGLCSALLTASEGHREHKVHNIVLYPDKHSWCKTQTIKQVISYPGCTSVEIDNNVCVGACFSYSIPHTEPSDPGEVIVPYCDSCQPSETTWNHVTLQCDKNDPETTPQLIKRVQIIQNCSCTSCDRDRYRNSKNGDNLDDSMGQQNNIPDLLNAIQIGNDTHPYNNEESQHHHLHHHHYPHIATMDSDQSQKVKDLMNHKIITLLQNIQANNSQHDKEQLIDLLRMIDDPEHKISDKSITEFVESMNSENIELNIPRLRDTLLKIENSKHYKQKQNGLTVDGNGTTSAINVEQSIETDDIEGSRAGIEHSHLKGSHIGMSLGHHILSSNRNYDDPQSLTTDGNLTTVDINRSTKSIEENFVDPNVEMQSSLKQHHHHHSHHHDLNYDSIHKVVNTNINNNNNDNGVNVNVNDNGVVIVHENQEDRSSIINPSHPHVHHHHHHHSHHMGESLDHGHLARGPHGALVIEPDRIHEKLNVNPHELKPNHAGTLLSYHSHAATNVEESKNSN